MTPRVFAMTRNGPQDWTVVCPDGVVVSGFISSAACSVWISEYLRWTTARSSREETRRLALNALLLEPKGIQ